MAEAATAEEVVDEETTCQSVLRLRASGPAGTPVSLPVPGAAQLLTLASPRVLGGVSWRGRVTAEGTITQKNRSPSPEVHTVGQSLGLPRDVREESTQPREGMDGIDLTR
jgi:hypothetical protein